MPIYTSIPLFHGALAKDRHRGWGAHVSREGSWGWGQGCFFPSADGNRYLISDGEFSVGISRSTTTVVGVSTTMREGVYEIHIIRTRSTTTVVSLCGSALDVNHLSDQFKPSSNLPFLLQFRVIQSWKGVTSSIFAILYLH